MKIQIVFQNLKQSEFVQQIVAERIQSVMSKFPKADNGTAIVYVSKENSHRHAGPDFFQVKVMLKGLKKMRPMILVKHSQNLYDATALAVDSLFENFHRHSEKILTKRRSSQRSFKRQMRTFVQS